MLLRQFSQTGHHVTDVAVVLWKSLSQLQTLRNMYLLCWEHVEQFCMARSADGKPRSVHALVRMNENA